MVKKDLCYDFSTMPDGLLPFSFVSIREKGIGYVFENEDSPELYFKIEDGKAVFHYLPTLEGTDTLHHGLLSSLGHIEGLNTRLSVVFSDPKKYFLKQNPQDEFLVDIALGFRASNRLEAWIGGRFVSWWDGAVWVNEIQVIEYAKEAITVLARRSITLEFLKENGLNVWMHDKEIEVEFNGCKIKAGSNFRHAGPLVTLRTKIYSRLGTQYRSLPLISYLEAKELTTGKVLPIREFPYQVVYPPPQESVCYQIPVTVLLKEKALKSLGPGIWQFTKDTLVEVYGYIQFGAKVGDTYARVGTKTGSIELCRARHL